MSPTDIAAIQAAVTASTLLPRYGTAIDRESAREILTKKMEAAAASAAAAERAEAEAKEQAAYDKQQREAERREPRQSPTRRRQAPAKDQGNPLTDFLGSRQGQSMVRGVVQGIFGTLRRH